MVKVSNEEKIKDLYKKLGESIDVFFDKAAEEGVNIACQSMILDNIREIDAEMYKLFLLQRVGLKLGDAIKVDGEIRLICDFGVTKDRTFYITSTDYRGNNRTDVISGYFTENGIHVINSKKEIK